MAFHFFSIPVAAPEAGTEALNAFLRSHRIVKVDRQLVDQGATSIWVLCVEYVDGAAAGLGSGGSSAARTKTDYKEILSETDFAFFAKLRDQRKAIAQRESVPVYTIFTNDQLAQMVISKATTRAALSKIEGLGEARLEKYGERMLEILTTFWREETVSHEASGKSV